MVFKYHPLLPITIQAVIHAQCVREFSELQLYLVKCEMIAPGMRGLDIVFDTPVFKVWLFLLRQLIN